MGISSTAIYAISTVIEQLNDGIIIPDPEWQREYVWDEKKASKLVESVLMGLPIPLIYLCEEPIEEDGEEHLSVVDGQQRLTSLYRYYNGDFKLKGLESLPELNGKVYKDLSKADQIKFKNCNLSICTLSREADPNLKFQMFERLNTKPTPLLEQEIRNCIYRGSFNNMLRGLVRKDKKVLSMFGIDAKKANRYRIEEWILKFFMYYYEGIPSGSLKNAMNVFMNKHKNDSSEDIKAMKSVFTSTLNRISEVFGEGYFKKKNTLLKYEALMIIFSKRTDTTRYRESIKEKVEKVFESSEWHSCCEVSTSSKPNTLKRFKMIEEAVYSCLPEHDSKRIFSDDVKQTLWNRSHVCALCGNEILDYSHAAVDHIIPWSMGGPTTIGNAQLAHCTCNKSKGNENNP